MGLQGFRVRDPYLLWRDRRDAKQGSADDGEVICSCGQPRTRASKAPDRVLPCRLNAVLLFS